MTVTGSTRPPSVPWPSPRAGCWPSPSSCLSPPGSPAPTWDLIGGFGPPGTLPLTDRIEEGFGRQIASLPSDTRRLLRVAAACPVGDPARIWRAGERLGLPAQAAIQAVEAGLIEFGTWVRFRHPLVRSAAYHSASLGEWQEAHRALAEVTDPLTDPDRRAWHRAQATPGPDEAVAAELASSAGRAQARGGLAAAAAYLDRAATLTPDPAARAQRLLDAARAKRDAGELDAALDLLAAADAGPPDELRTAEAQRLHGQIALEQRRGHDAARLLIGAALITRLRRHMSERALTTPTEWALGTEACLRALAGDSDVADACYQEAIDRLSRTRVRAYLARVHLLYGEWLRREKRRAEAREHLRRAYEMLTAMGVEGFAERARRELQATGEAVRKRGVTTVVELTAQEAQIARLARAGLSNPEISTRLFISPRTVEWHLRKVFAKLGISSRRQLRGPLPAAVQRALQL